MKKVERSDNLEVISVYDLEEFSIGHDVDLEAITGCTVIMANKLDGLVAGADVRGGAPGTRNLDIYKPMNCYDSCQAVVLSGGSLFDWTPPAVWRSAWRSTASACPSSM